MASKISVEEKEYCPTCKTDVIVQKKMFNTHICSKCQQILSSNISAENTMR